MSQTTAPLWPLRSARCAARDVAFAPIDILRFDLGAIGVSAAEDNAAAGDLSLIDDHEAAQDRIAIMVVHDERAAGLDGDFRHVVARDEIAVLGHDVERRGIDDLLDGDDLRVQLLGGELDLRALAYGEVALAHPEDARLETVGFDRRLGLVRGDVAALDKDLFG